METDKKVEEYLERAMSIEKKIWTTVNAEEFGSYQKTIVEIAKMIQLEEHREQIEITPEKDMLSVMRDNLDYHKTFAKHKAEIDEIEMQRNNPLKIK